MTTADAPASKEAVTAALLVIGGKILSGRTKDQNIGYIAEYLTAVGIDFKEVRVVGDEERAIVDALNALRPRFTYIFTTGGIGPTHGDITADCVAKSFGVPIDTDPRALAILHEWVKTTGRRDDGDDGLVGKILNQVDLLVGKRPDLLTVNEVASGRRRDELARDAAHQQHGKAKARRLREARLARAIPSARRN